MGESLDFFWYFLVLLNQELGKHSHIQMGIFLGELAKKVEGPVMHKLLPDIPLHVNVV